MSDPEQPDLPDVPPPGEEERVVPGQDTDERPGLETALTAADEQHLKGVLESLVFVSDRPVTLRRLARIVKVAGRDVRRLLNELTEEYAMRGIHLQEVAGGFQFRSAPANAPFVREVIAGRPTRLSRAQLETLAIVAYRQPLTRPEVEEIRGVDSAGGLKILLERGLVKVLGRKDEPGRPLLYGTTPAFLELFGLRHLEDLPSLKEFTELTEESRDLFARRTGEHLEELGSIEVDEAEARDGGEQGELFQHPLDADEDVHGDGDEDVDLHGDEDMHGEVHEDGDVREDEDADGDVREDEDGDEDGGREAQPAPRDAVDLPERR
ncbi:MAG: SMC-Scp complex subunit ScpB [Sandaracinaceae bacterium]